MAGRDKIHIIAIAGGSCSGKTRLAEHTYAALGGDVCTIVRQDNYYLDLGGAKPGAPLPNFDHPDAFDWDLLRADLALLKSGQCITMPIYDFTSHRRTSRTESIRPTPIILVEGILILHNKRLREVFDYSFFVDCPPQTRLARRLARDTKERGRTRESIRAQFAQHVAPMHDKFVKPGKQTANTIITQDQCSLEHINTGPVINLCRALLSH